MIAERLVVSMLLATAAGLAAANFDVIPTNDMAQAQAEGRNLARQLCEQRPIESITNTGVLIIRDAKRHTTNVPVKIAVFLAETNWLSIYAADFSRTNLYRNYILESEVIEITHVPGQPNRYERLWGHCGVSPGPYGAAARDANLAARRILSAEEAMTPFAGADFWLADLGMEFFHWPAQKLLKKELKHSQSCAVLESRNPVPATNGYSRVVSWIDIDTGGIVRAEAYDARGKLLKEFELKEAEKVNGQWKVSELQMRNLQTGSRTTLKFDFGKP